MEEALLVPNIRIFSEHKAQTVDFERRIVDVHDVVGDRTNQVEFDLCIGADGSHSLVRRQLMRVTRYVLWVPYVLCPVTASRTVGMMESCQLGRSVDPCVCYPEWTINKSTFPTNTWNSRCQQPMMRAATQRSLLIQITSTYGHAIHLCLWDCRIRCALFPIHFYLAPLFLNPILRDLIG